MLIAHRGVTNKYQENTFDAISAIMALEKPSLTTDSQTCNQQIGVEFDIQQLKSGEIVIYHDETLKRLHNDPRVITEIDKNTAMNFNIAFFDSVLDLFKNTNYILDIEVKLFNEIGYKNICNKIVDMILQRKMESMCFVSSFNFNVVMFFLKNYPTIKCYLIIDSLPSILLLGDLHKNGMKKLVIEKEEFEKNYMYYTKFDPIIYCVNDTSDPLLLNVKNVITDCIEMYTDV